MTREKFTAAYDFICDRCGETVKAGTAAVAEFDTATGTARMMHARCPGIVPEKARRPGPKPRTIGARRPEVKTASERRFSKVH